MSTNGEIRHFEVAQQRHRWPLRKFAGLVVAAATGVAGGILLTKEYQLQHTEKPSSSTSAPGTTEVFAPTAETEGIQALYICTIQNADGSVSTVEINIYGPETPVEIAKILAGQTGSAAGILLDGINSYNARYGADLALLVGNDMEVLNLSEGIGASAITSTQGLGLKNEILGDFVHHGEETVASTLAP